MSGGVGVAGALVPPLDVLCLMNSVRNPCPASKVTPVQSSRRLLGELT